MNTKSVVILSLIFSQGAFAEKFNLTEAFTKTVQDIKDSLKIGPEYNGIFVKGKSLWIDDDHMKYYDLSLSLHGTGKRGKMVLGEFAVEADFQKLADFACGNLGYLRAESYDFRLANQPLDLISKKINVKLVSGYPDPEVEGFLRPSDTILNAVVCVNTEIDEEAVQPEIKIQSQELPKLDVVPTLPVAPIKREDTAGDEEGSKTVEF